MKNRRAGREGFTIVELLVGLVTGVILLSGIFQVLMTNQKIQSTRGVQMQGRQAQLAAMDVLFAELREISPTGGDLISMSATSVQFRAQRKFGITCAVNTTTGALDIIAVGSRLEVGDSIFVFADGDEKTRTDDTWHPAEVNAVDTTSTCLGTPAATVTMPGLIAPMAVDSIRIGAPIRSFERYTYSLAQDGGVWYMMRTPDGGSAVPMVGPLRSSTDGGLSFVYRNALGATTTTPSEVAQIVLTVRTGAEAFDSQGNIVRDSMSVAINLRN